MFDLFAFDFSNVNTDARGTAWAIDPDGNAHPLTLRIVDDAGAADPFATRLVLQNDETATARVEIRAADLVEFFGRLLGVDILGVLSALGALGALGGE